MHPIDITAAVHKRGLTLMQISRDAGLSTSACGYAIRNPSARAEAAILAALGMPGHKVWPDRYDATGRRRIRQLLAATTNRDFSARRAGLGQ